MEVKAKITNKYKSWIVFNWVIPEKKERLAIEK